MTWRHWVASLGDSGVDKPALDWPSCGQSPGRLMAATHSGGGVGERRDGMVTMCDMSDVSTAVA